MRFSKVHDAAVVICNIGTNFRFVFKKMFLLFVRDVVPSDLLPDLLFVDFLSIQLQTGTPGLVSSEEENKIKTCNKKDYD